MADEDRDLLVAYESLVCKQCGNLISVCSDPNVDWHPRIAECWASAAVEWGKRRLAEKYPEKKKANDGAHPLDGVSVWASQDPPEVDDFL